MKTGSFFTIVRPGRISIARSQPRNYKLPEFRPLAPGKWFHSVTEAEYRVLYAEQLAQLDSQQVWDELHRIAGDHEPVICCWEKPGEFCHRRLVAEWLEDSLGVDVPELLPKTRLVQASLF